MLAAKGRRRRGQVAGDHRLLSGHIGLAVPRAGPWPSATLFFCNRAEVVIGCIGRWWSMRKNQADGRGCRVYGLYFGGIFYVLVQSPKFIEFGAGYRLPAGPRKPRFCCTTTIHQQSTTVYTCCNSHSNLANALLKKKVHISVVFLSLSFLFLFFFWRAKIIYNNQKRKKGRDNPPSLTLLSCHTSSETRHRPSLLGAIRPFCFFLATARHGHLIIIQYST